MPLFTSGYCADLITQELGDVDRSALHPAARALMRVLDDHRRTVEDLETELERHTAWLAEEVARAREDLAHGRDPQPRPMESGTRDVAAAQHRLLEARRAFRAALTSACRVLAVTGEADR